VKRRFGSSLAHRLLPLGAARAYAPKHASLNGARAAGRSWHFRLPMHMRRRFAGAVLSIYTEAQR
jgi:hypothetical protein